MFHVLAWVFILAVAIFAISVPNNFLGIAVGFFALGSQTVNILNIFLQEKASP